MAWLNFLEDGAMAHTCDLSLLVEVQKKSTTGCTVEGWASQWAQLQFASLVGLVDDKAQNRLQQAQGCSLELDDGWHGAEDEAELVHELSGRGPEATLTSHFRNFEPHNDMATMWLSNRLSSSAVDGRQMANRHTTSQPRQGSIALRGTIGRMSPSTKTSWAHVLIIVEEDFPRTVEWASMADTDLIRFCA